MNPRQILLAVCAVWVASEMLLLVIKRSHREDVTRKDRGSLFVVSGGIAASCFLASFLSAIRATRLPVPMRWTAFWTGLALIVIGVAIRFAAILTLRRYFTVDVAIAKDHKVIDTGLYGIVRHPSYAGSLLSFLGLGLSFLNWLSLAVMIAGPLLVLSYRVRVEERALIEALGDQYRTYAARTKRFIPGVF